MLHNNALLCMMAFPLLLPYFIDGMNTPIETQATRNVSNLQQPKKQKSNEMDTRIQKNIKQNISDLTEQNISDLTEQNISDLIESIERRDEQKFNTTMEKIRYMDIPDMDIPGVDQGDVSALYNPIIIPHQQKQMTALHYAAENGFSYGVENIMQHPQKVDINVTDTAGETPLHYAVDKGHIDIVQQLLRYGANPELKDTDNRSAINIAYEYKDRSPQMQTIYTILTTSIQDLFEQTYNTVAFLHRAVHT